ncbi:GreA/GreB family elongation factor, partial [Streptomyces tubercidicus]
YSPQSPLGTGVNGKKVGTEAEYELPNGKTATVKILDAKPYTG